MFRTATAILFSIALNVPLCAAPIEYTITTVGSGSWGGNAFADREFSIVARADTNNITSGLAYVVINDSTTVSVQGLGSAEFTNTIQTVSNNGVRRGGFGDVDLNLAILSVHNAAFLSYDLSTNLGPVSGPVIASSPGPFPTTAGAFEITGLNLPFSRATFTALLVPEPCGSCMLLVSTLSALFMCKR